MSKRAFAALFIAAVLVAAGLRLPRLGLRPMHHDEANQALKFGLLLERGEYRYDLSDHHGPSLYYLSLPFALSISGRSLAALDEATLRLVTASFGLGTILLLLLFIPMLGRAAVAWGSVALAVSPVMTYFSRFYIQETLLVFFLVGFAASVWRYFRHPHWGWAAAAGFGAGMMYATKETSIIAFGAAAAAFLLAHGWKEPRRGTAVIPSSWPSSSSSSSSLSLSSSSADSRTGSTKGEDDPARPGGRWLHLALAAVVALAVAFLFFSSFLKNPRGFLDSILSFKIYFTRAGEGGFHVQPWHYYLGKLACSPGHGGPFWSEGLILILALFGAAPAFVPRLPRRGDAAFLRFLAFYSFLAAAVYSAIPYKTPWNLLPFTVGFIMLAGAGAASLVSLSRQHAVRIGLALVLGAGFAQLGSQSYRASFVYPADTRNPYVYAQTSPDYLKLVRRVEDIAALSPDARNLLVKVIAGPYETWPLPWSLRRFGRVGYWTDVASAGEIGRPPVIIASADAAAGLEPALGTDYQPEIYGLRPETFLSLFIRNDLWQSYLASRGR